MTHLVRMLGACVVVLVVAGTAAAQQATSCPQQGDDQTPQLPPSGRHAMCATPAPTPPLLTTTPEAGPPARSGWREIGFALSVGGGVDDFTRGAMRRLTETGETWTARLTIGTHSYVAGEVSYLGSDQRIIDAPGFRDARLLGNGVQGALRFNVTTHQRLQPFLYGGAGWRHYTILHGPGSDDVLEFPVGVGIAGYAGSVMLDVRGEYRAASDDNALMPGVITGTPSLDRWGLTGNVGFAF